MKKILLIDTSSLLYKSRHTIGNKLSHKEMETGLMFGFFMQVLKLGNKFKTNKFQNKPLVHLVHQGVEKRLSAEEISAEILKKLKDAVMVVY